MPPLSDGDDLPERGHPAPDLVHRDRHCHHLARRPRGDVDHEGAGPGPGQGQNRWSRWERLSNLGAAKSARRNSAGVDVGQNWGLGLQCWLNGGIFLIYCVRWKRSNYYPPTGTHWKQGRRDPDLLDWKIYHGHSVFNACWWHLLLVKSLNIIQVINRETSRCSKQHIL